ncbi:UNVERIFIED_ORG: Fic-DOC domain mobile mystery protein B [Rhizobium esperanzae]
MTDLFQEPEDATPLEPQEREGLLQSWITHRNDLNEAEQENIVKGAAWVRGRRRIPVDRMLTEDSMRTLHRRMFGEVWQWAGHFRATERNIGVEAYRIPVELAALLADVRYWIEHEAFAADEIAIRFHHRLVAIHPFPNGNGRHARLAADLLVGKMNKEPFSWGSGSLSDMGELRRCYVAALQAADNHDIGPLLEFARS